MKAKRARLRGLSCLFVSLPLGCSTIVGADFDEKTISGATGSGQGGAGGDGAGAGGRGGGGSCPIGEGPVTSIVAGHEHTCALMSDYGVRCWGSNAYGQLGLGTADASPHPQPIAVPCLSGVKQVAAGKSHTCALNAEGEVFCWGRNHEGQLGTGDFSAYTSPQKVKMLDPAQEITAGDDFTCARMNLGDTAFCWGANGRKQLGSGFPDPSSSIPIGALLNNSTVIAAGSEHACALHNEGQLACWGKNTDGQAGVDPAIETEVDQPTPIMIATAPVQLAMGGVHSCALASDKLAYCWGSNSDGQLDPGAATPYHFVPEPVSFPTETLLSAIALGGHHSCAIQDEEKAVFCWGKNSSGQLGAGNFDLASDPVPVMLAAEGGVKALALGFAHSCALAQNAVKCWGDNAAGQLGVSVLEPAATPVDALTW
jgi:alpha-tubulin suppressor-like RCC1 family protein